MSEIYRMKIRQVQIKGSKFSYFPFDNVYIVPTEDVDRIAPKLFRYCLRMEATDIVIQTLRKIDWQQSRRIGLKRNDDELKWKDLASTADVDAETEFLSKGNWTCIIPTYAIVAPKQKEPKKHPQLQYLVTHAIKNIHNRFSPLPPLVLQTPKRTIPALCAICKHMAAFYQNKCAPGTYHCSKTIHLNNLEEDTSNADAVEKSIQNAGAVE